MFCLVGGFFIVPYHAAFVVVAVPFFRRYSRYAQRFAALLPFDERPLLSLCKRSYKAVILVLALIISSL